MSKIKVTMQSAALTAWDNEILMPADHWKCSWSRYSIVSTAVITVSSTTTPLTELDLVPGCPVSLRLILGTERIAPAHADPFSFIHKV